MSDFVQDSVSPQNLFNIAQGGGGPASDTAPTPAPVPIQQPMPDNTGIDAFIPPAMGNTSNNVVHLPQFNQRRYFAYELAPPEAQKAIDFDSKVKVLTDIIKAKESTNNYQAVNRERPGNTASGAYQYTDSTWNNYGGYPKAALAPPAVQDRRFHEDIVRRLAAFGGDPYKAIAAHYLPALANDPKKWDKPFSIHGRKVKPVLTYVRYIIKGTPLEAGLDEYLKNG